MPSSAYVPAKSDYLRSSYRESLVEHLFIGSLLRHFWDRGVVEVLKPQVDGAGYDLVLEYGGVIRYVQLKATRKGAKTAVVKLNVHLTKKTNGCVVAVVHDLTFDPAKFKYGWYGRPPGQLLPTDESLKVARTAKWNKAGVRKERPGIRDLPYSKFERGLTLDELTQRLFGKR